MLPSKRRISGQIESAPTSAHSETRLRTPVAGQYVSRYGRVRQVLLGYLSPILVDSVLSRALSARNLSPTHLSDSTLAELTGDIMIGLRLFVPEARLSELMLELAECLES
jgi:hypothetical protein